MQNFFQLNIPFFLITIFITLCAILIIATKNPVHSVFYLVLVFILSTVLFLLLKVEFIALLFLIVYVGAIIVLFLFVIMMLNVRILEINERIISYIPIALIITTIFFILLLSLVIFNFIPELSISNSEFLDNFYFFDLFNKFLTYINYNNIDYISFFNLTNFNDLSLIGFVLYTDYVYIFLLAGIVLFVAMIGSIVLTLIDVTNQTIETKITKRQDFYLQTNKDITKSIRFLKNKK